MKLVEQIKLVRDSGLCNMFDVVCVRAVAAVMGLNELYDYLSDRENLEKYVMFIFTGDESVLQK